MKLPRNFPDLEDPKFILANPVWLQVGVLVLIATFSTLGVFWALRAYISNTVHYYHYCVAAISVIALSGVVYPRNWRRGVIFAADIHGVYFTNYRGNYTFIPWNDVGESRIGIAGRAQRQKTVILNIRVDNDTWEKMQDGKSTNLLKSSEENIDNDGYRSIGIGNACRNVGNTRKEIELLRLKNKVSLGFDANL